MSEGLTFISTRFAVNGYKLPRLSTSLGTMCDFSVTTACQSELHQVIIPYSVSRFQSVKLRYVIFCDVTDLNLEVVTRGSHSSETICVNSENRADGMYIYSAF
jgi:hypothetical protein